MPNKLVAVDPSLGLPPAVRDQLSADLISDMEEYVTDAETASGTATTAAATAVAAAAAATSIVTGGLDPANAVLITDPDSDTYEALENTFGGPRVVPAYAVGSTWPARPLVDPDDMVLWVGDPTGSAPPGMLSQDIWTRAPITSDGIWQPYTPVLSAATTPPVMGSGTVVTGRYVKVGTTVTGWASFTFGTGFTPGSGTWSISLPMGSASDGSAKVVGSVYAVDTSASSLRLVGVVLLASGGGTVTITFDNTTAAGNPATPFAWTVSDIMRLNFCYESAT